MRTLLFNVDSVGFENVYEFAQEVVHGETVLLIMQPFIILRLGERAYADKVNMQNTFYGFRLRMS